MAVNLSPFGGVGAQLFDNNGVILSGGKIYTYVAGTTTPLATYTSSSGSTALSNPIVLNASGRVPTGEIWLTDGLSYKFVVKDANDVLIATYDNLSGINSNFVNFVTSSETQTATAGQTVFTLTTMQYIQGTNSLVVYRNGSRLIIGDDYVETSPTVVTLTMAAYAGDLMAFFAQETANPGSPIDASQVTYIPDGTGAVVTNVQAKLRETVSVLDFGATPDWNGITGTDNGPAFRAAILSVAVNGGVVIAPFGQYKISSTVIIPSNVTLDLQNSIIQGPGIGSTTDVFQSGYYSSGSVVTNIGTPSESHLVTHAAIKNATIQNCGTAINLFNWLWVSEVSNIIFWNCTKCIYSDSCWYSRYSNLISRGSANNTSQTAFTFVTYTNVEQIESVFVSDRYNFGIELLGGANGIKLFNCSVEGSANGLFIGGETGPLSIDTCYFEALGPTNSYAGTGIYFNDSGYKYNCSITNCWFYNMGLAIRGPTGGSNIYVSETNRFAGTISTKVDFSDNYNAYGKIEILPTAISNNGTPGLPSGYSIGGKARVEHDNIIFDGTTGLGIVKTKVHGTTLIAFEHEGNSGSPQTNTVSFCTVTKSAGTTFDLYVDTKINYAQFSAMLVYRFQVTDNVSAYDLYGIVFGSQVKQLDSTAKTVTVSNNGGYVRLTLSSFTHPSSTYSCTGTVRHM